MDVIMQKLIELEEKINYLISLQQPQMNQLQQPFQIPPPNITSYQQSAPQIMPNYQQSAPQRMPDYQQSAPQRMPDYQYKERMFPTGVEPQRFGVLTRGGGKQS